MPDRPLVSILLLAHNKRVFTERCLTALRATDYPSLEFWLVNNGSTDGTKEFFDQAAIEIWKHPGWMAQRLDFEENVGAIDGRNAALEKARGEYIVFIDNDVVASGADWLRRFVTRMEADPGLGATGPLLLFPKPAHMVQCAGCVVSRSGRVGFIGRGDDARKSEYHVEREVQALISACWILRKEVVRRIGLLDRAYHPVQYEDIDYCYRMREAGFRCLFFPEVAMHHYENVTTDGTSEINYKYVTIKNGIEFKRRWRRMYRHEDGPPDAQIEWKTLPRISWDEIEEPSPTPIPLATPLAEEPAMPDPETSVHAPSLPSSPPAQPATLSGAREETREEVTQEEPFPSPEPEKELPEKPADTDETLRFGTDGGLLSASDLDSSAIPNAASAVVRETEPEALKETGTDREEERPFPAQQAAPVASTPLPWDRIGGGMVLLLVCAACVFLYLHRDKFDSRATTAPAPTIAEVEPTGVTLTPDEPAPDVTTAAKPEPPPSEPKQPSPDPRPWRERPITGPLPAPNIVIYRKSRILLLRNEDEIVRIYQQIATAPAAGRKRAASDGLNPLGVYRIAALEPGSSPALVLDYPNREDAKAAFDTKRIDAKTLRSIESAQEAGRLPPPSTPLGGGVRIAGDPAARNAARGDFALAKEAMAELYRAVRPGAYVWIVEE